MTHILYFDHVAGGDLDSNMDVFRDFEGRASATSPVSEDRLTFSLVGSDHLRVEYDDDGQATGKSLDGLAAAIEAVYGASHRRTVTKDE